MGRAFLPLALKRITGESRTATLNNFRITNVFGEQINCQQSQMEYFNSLKKEWS